MLSLIPGERAENFQDPALDKHLQAGHKQINCNKSLIIMILLRSASREEITLQSTKALSPDTELDRIAMPPPQSPMGTM